MMRLKSDLLPLLEATIDGKLDRVEAEWHQDPAICVVLTAKGYPGAYDKGKEISGLDKLANWRRGVVFHAGTAKENNRWLTTGGRVLGVTARGRSMAEAVKRSLSCHRRNLLGRHALSQRHRPPGVTV